jgi:transposase
MNRRTEYLPNFEKEEIVGGRIAGACVAKSATLLSVSRATVSKVMSAYAYHGKTTSAKRKNGRNPILTERDRRILRMTLSKHHTTTAAQVTEQQNLIFILKTQFPQKLSDVSFTNPTSRVGLHLLKL